MNDSLCMNIKSGIPENNGLLWYWIILNIFFEVEIGKPWQNLSNSMLPIMNTYNITCILKRFTTQESMISSFHHGLVMLASETRRTLGWYWTPCNIYNGEKNTEVWLQTWFKNFKICYITFAPKMHL